MERILRADSACQQLLLAEDGRQLPEDEERPVLE